MLWIEHENKYYVVFVYHTNAIDTTNGAKGCVVQQSQQSRNSTNSWSLSIAGYVLSFSAFLSPSGERRKIKSCAGGAAWRDAGESTYRPHWCARSLPHIAATRRRNATSAQLLSALSSGIRVALPAPHNNATTVRLPPPTYYTAHFVNINTVFHLRFFLK